MNLLNFFKSKKDPKRSINNGVESNQINQSLDSEHSAPNTLWGRLNEQSTQHIKDNKWGLYRNTRLDMAEMLLKEDKHAKALVFLFEVCYLDINNPNTIASNITRSKLPKDMASHFTEFEGFLAPGVLNRLNDTISHLNIPLSEVNKIFIKTSTKNQNEFFPVTPEKAWDVLKEDLSGES
jgi:hypothetical protein